MFIIFFLLCIFINISNADIVLFSDQTLRDAALGSRPQTDLLCGVALGFFPSLTCSVTPALLSYTGDTVASFPVTYSFPTSSVVTGPGGIVLGVWSTIFPPTPTPTPTVLLTNSLLTANVITGAPVLPPDQTYWTGSLKDGTVAPTETCTEWTTVSPTAAGRGGFYSAVNGNWFAGSLKTCNTNQKLICVCIPMTNSPTLNPTLKPTAKPTTKTPTKDPTRNPTPPTTTTSPSLNPTLQPVPTTNPTTSPVIPDTNIQVMYMLLANTQASIYKPIGNISYFVTQSDVNSPVNLTITTENSAVWYPVKWVDVYYRLYTASTNLTTTEYIDECAPGENKVQGTTPMGLDGLRRCPTMYECQTSGCTSELAPIGVDHTEWSTLRTCICNKTITIRSDLPTLPSGVARNVSLVDARATEVTPSPTNPVIILGIVECNNAIEREFNCQFSRRLLGYVFQCADQDIGCYDQSIGRFFGLLNTQNPGCDYSIPVANWTSCNWEGIASILNYKIYSKDDKLIDPFTSQVWNLYYWFQNLTSLSVTSTTYNSADLRRTLQVDILQAQDYNYVSGELPPPSSVYNSYPVTAQEQTCLTEMSTGTYTTCTTLTWEVVEDWRWRYPGVTESINVTADQVIYSLVIQFTQNYTGVEVFNIHGELCGTALSPTIGQTITFVCLNTPSAMVSANGTITIRYHGVGALWDIAGISLSPYVPVLVDPLASYLDLGAYESSSFLNMMYGYGYFVSGLPGSYTNWPNRMAAGPIQPASIYTLNYTSLTSNSEISTAWEEVTNNILLYNQYPYNYALAARAVLKEYDMVDVDYENPQHLQYLYDIWANWLAMRHASEDVQCETFGLGRVIFSSQGSRTYWLQYGTTPNYVIPAGSSEGGCRCRSTFNEGFYDFSGGCQQCLAGYGPKSVENWNDIIQYQSLVSEVYPDIFPFWSNLTVPEFQQYLSCRFPTSVDRIVSSLVDYNFCGGNGIVQFEQTESTFNITLYPFKQYWLTPTCEELLIDGEYYTLQNVTDIFSLQYVGATNIVSIVNDAIYFSFGACILTLTQEFPLPFYGELDCSGTGHTIACINEDLFSEESINFSLGRLSAFSTYISYFVN